MNFSLKPLRSLRRGFFFPLTGYTFHESAEKSGCPLKFKIYS